MAAGRKTGGRVKGTPNRRTIEKTALVEQYTAEGITPLEVMLGAMREAWVAGDKPAAASIAKDAAPYMHPKLSSVDVEHSGNADSPVHIRNEIEMIILDANQDEVSSLLPEEARATIAPRQV